MAITVPRARAAAAEQPPAQRSRPSSRPGTFLVVALLAAATYAAFAGGAAGHPSEARLQVALCAVAVAAAAIFLWHGGLRLDLPAAAWAALGLLAAFAVWTGLSLAWSIEPSATWAQLNRGVAYVLVLLLALTAGAWSPRAIPHVAAGFVGVAVLVALYALGGKVAPGLEIPGVLDLDHTRDFSRLRAPLEYWNALALLCAMAVPSAVRLATDERSRIAFRLAGLAALTPLLATMGLTYSRGGVVALAVALFVLVALGGARLRTLLFFALGLASTVPALIVGFTADDLTTNMVAASDRQAEGLLLGALLLGGLVALVVVGRLVILAEARVGPDPVRSRRIGTALAGLAAAALLVGIAATALSDRGLGGTISHQWDTFTRARSADVFDPARLLSTNSGNRWVWWEEAAGAWWDHPLAGSGAGSFVVLHLQYRDNQLAVRQPHSVPLQFLAETGVVGALLALGGLGALAVAALGGTRRRRPGRERGLAAALAAGGLAWLVHGLYDWDWDIPGVTLPGLVLLGVLAARPRRPGPRPAGGHGGRLLALALGTLFLSGAAVSAILPAWSQSEANRALGDIARRPSPEQLRTAAARAELAARLDPLALDPLLTAAGVAERRGRRSEARRYLVEAVRRQPDSATAWLRLAVHELSLGDLVNFSSAIRRSRELDPYNRFAQTLLISESIASVPPQSSPTATGTPLVTVLGQEDTGGADDQGGAAPPATP